MKITRFAIAKLIFTVSPPPSPLLDFVIHTLTSNDLRSKFLVNKKPMRADNRKRSRMFIRRRERERDRERMLDRAKKKGKMFIKTNFY